MKSLFAIILALGVNLVYGQDIGAYNRNEALRQQDVLNGVILAKSPVQVKAAPQTGVGQFGGSAIGAIIGGALGMTARTEYRYQVSAIGTAIGGLLGNTVQSAVINAPSEGMEYIVKIESGRVISIVQDDGLSVGQEVYVVTGQNMRLAPR